MLNNKEINQAEELSECLDHLNTGRHPTTQDEEIRELVGMANFIKQSHSQDDVPQLLIDELVDHLAAECTARKRQIQRAHWLYGGLVSTAAAVLIAAFVQFLPPAANHNIAQGTDDSIRLQENVVVADQASVPIISQLANPMIEQPIQSGSTAKEPVTVAVAKKAIDDLPQKIVEIIQVAKSPPVDQKMNQVARLQQEGPKDMARTQSVLMAKTDIDSLWKNKRSQLEPGIAMMVLPNQIAQSITVDHISGVIRQVYNQGTHDEIMITQRPLDESPVMMKGNAKDTINSLTVKVDKYDITIEGKQTKEELQKIAESLTVMK